MGARACARVLLLEAKAAADPVMYVRLLVCSACAGFRTCPAHAICGASVFVLCCNGQAPLPTRLEGHLTCLIMDPNRC